MNASVFIGLSQNVALLIALALVFDTIVLNSRFDRLHFKILTGVLFGALGMTVMLTPWEFAPGVMIDSRSVILGVGALFFGALPTIVAVLMTASLRFVQEGIGTWAGVGLIISSGFLGIFWRHLRLQKLNHISLIELYLFGVVVHIVMLLWMFLMPWPVAKAILSHITIPVMIVNPLGTLLLGKLMLIRLKRKKESETLLESESRWRSLTQTSPDLILTLNSNLIIEFANTSFSGHPQEDIIGTSIFQYIEEESQREKAKSAFEQVLKEQLIQSCDIYYHDENGEKIELELKIVPRRLEASNKVIGLTLQFQNVTKRNRWVQELQESENRLKAIIKDTKAGYFFIDKDGFFQEVNASWARMYKYDSPEEIKGCHFTSIQQSEDIEAAKVFVKGIMNGDQQYQTGEFSRKCKDGSIGYHTFTANPVVKSGQTIGIEGFIIDVTDRKKAEAEILNSLREKETLLQEIHHRVKNNMQVVSSLLKLQSSSIEDQRVKEALLESQNRIYAMSAIHETLYSSDSLSEIDVKAFVSKIAYSLMQSFAVMPEKIELKIDIEDNEIRLGIDKANPLGMIVNEIISNSLKYAFPGDKKGTISIKIRQNQRNLELNLMDDGIGFPEDFDWKETKTLGLNLIRTLAERQLDGSIILDNRPGTSFMIQFGLDSP